MPNAAALVYAMNDKPGCFCGFFKDISLTNTFDHEQFLAANALPGPDSLTRCLLYPSGLEGGSAPFTLQKDSEVSQIPGLAYGMETVATLPRPKQWHDRVMGGAVLQAVKLRRVGEVEVNEAGDAELQHRASTKNPTWSAFTQYCTEQETVQLSELEQGPPWLQKMLKDEQWRTKVVKHL